MELDYKILWFEDDKRFVKLYDKRIRRFLDNLGSFSLELIHKTDCDNLDTCLNKDFELILVDWNLNPGKSGENLSGDKLIEKIRSKGVVTEIIFYSGLDTFDKEPFKLNGVYFVQSGDDKLYSTIESVIEHTLKRNLRITVTRGLFIASTIELVEQLEDIISKILCIDGDPQKFFTDYVIQAEFFTDFSKYTIIKDFLRQKITMLEENIASSGGSEKDELTNQLEEIKKIKSLFNKFKDDIIELRNQLAHSKPIADKRNCLKIRNKEKRKYETCEFNQAKCKEIRKTFVKHSENIQKISSLVTS